MIRLQPHTNSGTEESRCSYSDGPGANFYIKTTPDSNLEVVGDEFNQGQAPYCVAVSKNANIMMKSTQLSKS